MDVKKPANDWDNIYRGVAQAPVFFFLFELIVYFARLFRLKICDG